VTQSAENPVGGLPISNELPQFIEVATRRDVCKHDVVRQRLLPVGRQAHAVQSASEADDDGLPAAQENPQASAKP